MSCLENLDPSVSNYFADIIELGLPFTDPIADGPVIQKSNTVRPIFLYPCTGFGLTHWIASTQEWSHRCFQSRNGQRSSKERT